MLTLLFKVLEYERKLKVTDLFRHYYRAAVKFEQ